MPGTLFVVATPIGNLEDLTFRALRTLREVDVIAAEDTRRTAKLLAHYEIRKPLVSLREHNEARETPRLLEQLAAGQNIALVSDAGTPTIADPGARLVRSAHERQLPVVPIPGPSAVITALSVSGFSGSQFVFLGFPPSSGSARSRWFEELAAERRVSVFFEAPHRIRRTLSDLTPYLGNKQIMVARELTKRFEELVINPKTTASETRAIGEFTVVVSEMAVDPGKEVDRSDEAADLVGRLTDNAAFERDEAVVVASKITGTTIQRSSRELKKRKILADQQSRP